MTGTDILIVEDEAVVGTAAQRILTRSGVSVQVVTDVESARPLLNEQTFRAILSDLMLPGASGLDLLQEVRSGQPDLPFVLMTGYATVENVAAAFKHGAFDILPKPFDLVELIGTMRRTLRFSDRIRSSEPPAIEPETTGDRYFMGEHSWAEIEADGVVRIGAGETFAGLLEDLDWVELPEKGNDLRQGTRAVRLLSKNEEFYRVWSPLTGTVLDVNEELMSRPDMLHQRPATDGWLLRMYPERLSAELEELTKREWRNPIA